MGNDVLLFFSFRKHKTGYYATLFDPLKARENEVGLHLYQGSLKDAHIEIIDGKLEITEGLTGRKLDTFKAVSFELWLKSPQQALAVATYLDRKGIPFRGREALNVLCSTKIGELVRMSDTGLPLPRTFMSSHREILKVFKENPPIQYPLIAKAADTFGGQMNYLVKSYKDLKQALVAHKDQFFVIQEFIPNDRDYRVLVMGGKIELVMKRCRGDEDLTHVNNTSAGGQGEFVALSELSPQMQKDALAAAAATLRSDFAGVDLIINQETGAHFILEVNEAPAIQTGYMPEVKTKTYLSYLKRMATANDGDQS